MFLETIEIRDDSVVTDLVQQDYRTSRVFSKYGIDYCCGGKLPLQKVCEVHGLDFNKIKNELHDVVRPIPVSTSLNFRDWSVDFLVDYIINVHHAYLIKNFPDLIDTLERSAHSHKAKYPYLCRLLEIADEFRDDLLPHLEQEENIIFPYLKQVAHAHKSREPYAELLVRTLRKPIEAMMIQEQEYIEKYLYEFRNLTNNYTPPVGACITHKVVLSKLKELDADLVHHIYLENEILFPEAIRIEKELKAANINR